MDTGKSPNKLRRVKSLEPSKKRYGGRGCTFHSPQLKRYSHDTLLTGDNVTQAKPSGNLRSRVRNFFSKGRSPPDRSHSLPEERRPRMEFAESLDDVESLLNEEEQFRQKLEFRRKVLRDLAKQGKQKILRTISFSFGANVRDKNTEEENSHRGFMRKYFRKAKSFSAYETEAKMITEKKESVDSGFDTLFCTESVPPTYKPSYWLSCSYTLVPSSNCLEVTLRQTGTLPEVLNKNPSFKITARVFIDSEKQEECFVLVKSKYDSSFRSNNFSFRCQQADTVKAKTLIVTLYLQKSIFSKSLISDWKIPLLNCSNVSKTVCKRFFVNETE